MEVLKDSEIKHVSGGWCVNEDAPNPAGAGFYLGVTNAANVLDILYNDLDKKQNIWGVTLKLAQNSPLFESTSVWSCSDHINWDTEGPA